MTRHVGRLHRLVGIPTRVGQANATSTARTGLSTAPRCCPTEQRTAILQHELVAVTSWGGRVITQSPTSATLVSGQPVNTVAHILATVFLCGLWLPVWIYIESTGGERRHTVTVDEYGGVHWTGPGRRGVPTPTPQRPSPFYDSK
jgi:hypothetical protein